MRVLISGSSGMVGSALSAFLSSSGHQINHLVRPNSPRSHRVTESVVWNPSTGQLDPSLLEGMDAVVHLAGQSIAVGRWTPPRKAGILESRIQGTSLLAGTLAKLRHPPRTLISASAIGFYDASSDAILTEDSPRGKGFLADVAEQWEQATLLAAQSGIRVVRLRLGIVLSPTGGALARMLLPFRLGLGGRLGNGNQWMSWIALDDVLGGIHYLLNEETLSGPVNGTSPQPVTNLEFTRTLGRVLSRPTVATVPAGIVRLMFGEMGEELLLKGARVQPARLLSHGYQFLYPGLEGALRHMLGKV
jgi:uncharacterized protein